MRRPSRAVSVGDLETPRALDDFDRRRAVGSGEWCFVESIEKGSRRVVHRIGAGSQSSASEDRQITSMPVLWAASQSQGLSPTITSVLLLVFARAAATRLGSGFDDSTSSLVVSRRQFSGGELVGRMPRSALDR
jgi:hypothetical protein